MEWLAFARDQLSPPIAQDTGQWCRGWHASLDLQITSQRCSAWILSKNTKNGRIIWIYYLNNTTGRPWSISLFKSKSQALSFAQVSHSVLQRHPVVHWRWSTCAAWALPGEARLRVQYWSLGNSIKGSWPPLVCKSTTGWTLGSLCSSEYSCETGTRTSFDHQAPTRANRNAINAIQMWLLPNRSL